MFKIFLILLTSTFIFANELGYVKTLIGKANVKRDAKIIELKIGSALSKDDILITQDESSLGVVFDDGSILTLGENSILKLNTYVFKPADKEYDVDLDLQQGKSSFQSGKIGKLSPESVKFRTPDGIIGIRGTKFFIDIKK